MSKEKNFIVGLDIGTSKSVVLAGIVEDDGQINILGIGVAASSGLRKGVIVSIDNTVDSIQKAVDQVQDMVEYDIDSVYASISGGHIHSFNSSGVTAIKNNQVTASDVKQAMDAARAVSIPADKQVLHVLAQDFIIDGQAGIHDPTGMAGVRLEVNAHIVTGLSSAYQNIQNSVEHCHLNLEDTVLQSLASSVAVLTEDERRQGVCLVDIGSGTSDIAIFSDGSIQHTAVIPIAGDQVSGDIAYFLRVPSSEAEAIKMRYACALTDLVSNDEYFEVPGGGERPSKRVARRSLVEVVEARYEELLELIYNELQRTGLVTKMVSGIVLTGGSAKIEGMVDLAEKVFDMPVRLGMPLHVKGLKSVVENPSYATVVGLLMTAHEHQNNLQNLTTWKDTWHKLRNWL